MDEEGPDDRIDVLSEEFYNHSNHHDNDMPCFQPQSKRMRTCLQAKEGELHLSASFNGNPQHNSERIIPETQEDMETSSLSSALGAVDLSTGETLKEVPHIPSSSCPRPKHSHSPATSIGGEDQDHYTNAATMVDSMNIEGISGSTNYNSLHFSNTDDHQTVNRLKRMKNENDVSVSQTSDHHHISSSSGLQTHQQANTQLILRSAAKKHTFSTSGTYHFSLPELQQKHRQAGTFSENLVQNADHSYQRNHHHPEPSPTYTLQFPPENNNRQLILYRDCMVYPRQGYNYGSTLTIEEIFDDDDDDNNNNNDKNDTEKQLRRDGSKSETGNCNETMDFERKPLNQVNHMTAIPYVANEMEELCSSNNVFFETDYEPMEEV